jgi:uncharacterized protein HemX
MLGALNTKLLLVVIALLGSLSGYLAYQNRKLTAIADALTAQNQRLLAIDAQRKAEEKQMLRPRTKQEEQALHGLDGMADKLQHYTPR